ncbi:helix-turn-helix domain-containing protein [Nocardioides sp. WS12]|uniref:helix-turn-helix domain-containing protein n=1 Tax=Nocardioides sp. WS12 TaxID=2486272 RepID=UPI00191D39BE|nr:helix-turn-helix domain-containing protein [Nocardioides sp. WS12]
MGSTTGHDSRSLSGVDHSGRPGRQGRRARRWNQIELAERAGISANTLRSIEQGAPSSTIGIVFEVAVLLGLDLFGAGAGELSALVAQGRNQLALLPKRVRNRPRDLQDDF